MKKLIFILLFLSLYFFSFAQSGSNTIKGTIDIPVFKTTLLKKGANYSEEEGSVSQEKKRIEALNSPQKNIYISCHSRDFAPQLHPTDNVKITQREKTFFPNIVAVTKGSTVQFINEDEFYHNVYSLSSKARFNIGRRPTGNVYGQKVNKTGVIKLGCDIHPEMSAVILSLNTPYFTKINADGSYEINSLPDGSYELRVYHPAIEKYTTEITVKGNEVQIQNIKLQTKA